MTKRQIKSLIFTNTIGTILEYLDATLYGFFAVIIATTFFPKEDQLSAILLSWGVFTVSFIARPFGALLFGYLGDRFGRKKALTGTITLMAAATISIGFIPSYSKIGILAPICLVLCRIMQGLAVSSEYTGSSIYVIESMEKNHGLFSGITTAAGSSGIFLASLLAVTFSNLHIENYWRIAFICAGGLIGSVGYYLRTKQPESQAFLTAIAAKALYKKPVRTLLKTQASNFLSCIFLSMYIGVAIYTILIYSSSYLTNLGVDNKTALGISTMLALTEACLSPFFGYMSDRFGLRRTLTFATISMMVLATPLFLLITYKSLPLTTLALIILAALVAAFDGPLAAYLIGRFDVPVRHSGVSLSYNLGAALLGGATPLTLTYLIHTTHNELVPAFALTIFALISTIILIKQKPTM
jgi:MHS family proline/betaine transporter-like MFS transporter